MHVKGRQSTWTTPRHDCNYPNQVNVSNYPHSPATRGHSTSIYIPFKRVVISCTFTRDARGPTPRSSANDPLISTHIMSNQQMKKNKLGVRLRSENYSYPTRSTIYFWETVFVSIHPINLFFSFGEWVCMM